jgi:hypothetical protein
MTATVQVGTAAQTLAPMMTRVMQIAERVDSARAAALAMPVGQSALLPLSPSATVTYVWAIDLAKVTGLRTVSGAPAFSVRYRDAPGVSPEDVSPAIVQLIGSAAGPRVMSALRGRLDQATRRQADWDLNRDLKQDVVASTVELTARGVAKITPNAPLPPGQYAIVMRPTGNKKFAGASVLSDAEEGRLFGTAWIFLAK